MQYLQIHMINNMYYRAATITRSNQVSTRKHFSPDKWRHNRHAWAPLCATKGSFTYLNQPKTVSTLTQLITRETKWFTLVE